VLEEEAAIRHSYRGICEEQFWYWKMCNWWAGSVKLFLLMWQWNKGCNITLWLLCFSFVVAGDRFVSKGVAESCYNHQNLQQVDLHHWCLED